LDQAKINNVVNTFFNSLKAEEDKMLDTGLTMNTTIDVLHQAVLQLVEQHPKRFQSYVKFFEFGCMYLNDDTDDMPEVSQNE